MVIPFFAEILGNFAIFSEKYQVKSHRNIAAKQKFSGIFA